MMQKDQPIGIFDSGVGGLTVMREVIQCLPQEQILYFADTARVPYGGRSKEAIIEYTMESAEFLQSQGIKLLLVACHTASVRALPILQRHLHIPVIGVVESGIQAVASIKEVRRAALLATASTVESGVYQALFAKHHPKIEVDAVACPLLVPLIEEGFSSHPATSLIVQHYLSLLENRSLDAGLLACTHYPLILPLIRSLSSSGIVWVDPSHRAALEVRHALETMNGLQSAKRSPDRFFVTDGPEKFLRQMSFFLGRQAYGSVEKVFLKKTKRHDSMDRFFANGGVYGS